MTIRNDEEMRMFEEALERCKKSVYLVTADGEQYDLKTPTGRYEGIAKMLNAKDYEEPELFTNCIQDEMVLFEYIRKTQYAA